MAKLLVAAETLVDRMLPSMAVRLVGIGFDNAGNVVLDLEGPDVPIGARELAVTIKREFLRGKNFQMGDGGVSADSFSIITKS